MQAHHQRSADRRVRGRHGLVERGSKRGRQRRPPRARRPRPAGNCRPPLTAASLSSPAILLVRTKPQRGVSTCRPQWLREKPRERLSRRCFEDIALRSVLSRVNVLYGCPVQRSCTASLYRGVTSGLLRASAVKRPRLESTKQGDLSTDTREQEHPNYKGFYPTS